jgi:hypothetical protein
MEFLVFIAAVLGVLVAIAFRAAWRDRRTGSPWDPRDVAEDPDNIKRSPLGPPDGLGGQFDRGGGQSGGAGSGN